MSSFRSGCFKWFLIGFCLLLLMSVVWSGCNLRSLPQPGEPAFLVSVETSHITSPLDANGDVDYLEAANQRLSEGVTPENNAMILLLKAVGPVVEGKPLSDEFFQRLGIERLPRSPKEGNYFREARDWLKDQPELAEYEATRRAKEEAELEAEMEFEEYSEEEEGELMEAMDPFEPEFMSPFAPDPSFEDQFEQQYSFAMAYPWTAKEFPLLDRWLKEMQTPLQHIRAASQRPRYYHPLVTEAESMRLLSCWLNMAQQQREFARLLQLSAMKELGDGNVDQAIDDILATYRLAHFTAEGQTLVEQLIAMAISGMADKRTIGIAASGKASKQQLLRMRDTIAALPELNDLVKCLDGNERFVGLDAALSAARDRSAMNSFSGSGEPGQILSGAAIRTADFAEVFRVLNYWYDRLVGYARIQNPADRTAALIGFDQEMRDLDIEISSVMHVTLTMLAGRIAKGRLVGSRLALLIMPAVQQVSSAAQRTESSRLMACLALELAAYKLDHGAFPQTLADLVPEYTAAIPNDTFTGSPFKYVLKDAGDEDGRPFELYNFGANGVDDGGDLDGSSGEDWSINFRVLTFEEYDEEN